MTIHITPQIEAAFEAHLNEEVDWGFLGQKILRRETRPFFDNQRHGFLEFAAGWQASRKQALEEAAKAVDALRDDAKEAEVHAKWRAAEADGLSESLQLAHASFWSTVSTVNGVLRGAANRIRALTSPIGDKA